MEQILAEYHIAGPIIGVCTFLIIGIFHPLVIKGEYHFGKRCKWWFLAAGIILLTAGIIVTDTFWSALLCVTAFSSFWSIHEIDEQVRRVERGWFPRNPNRKK